MSVQEGSSAKVSLLVLMPLTVGRWEGKNATPTSTADYKQVSNPCKAKQ